MDHLDRKHVDHIQVHAPVGQALLELAEHGFARMSETDDQGRLHTSTVPLGAPARAGRRPEEGMGHKGASLDLGPGQ